MQEKLNKSIDKLNGGLETLVNDFKKQEFRDTNGFSFAAFANGIGSIIEQHKKEIGEILVSGTRNVESTG